MMSGGERRSGSQLHLLARLWLREPNAETVNQACEQLGLPRADPTDLAQAFADLFVLNVPPYGSVFLDSPSELNGSSAGEVGRVFAESGFDPPELLEVAAPDHLGLLIGWAEGRDSSQLDLSWIPTCCLAVLREPRVHPFYARLAEKTLDWLEARASEKGEGEGPIPPTPSPPNVRPVGDSIVEAIRGEQEDDEVGLGRIVRFLLTPARSGLYFSRGRLGAIALELGLRLPFGSRFDVARALFVAAGESEIAPRLFDTMRGEVTWWEGSYDRLGRDLPGWSPSSRVWKDRLATTTQLLEAMREIAEG